MAEKQGFLQKEGDKFKTWKKRWCVAFFSIYSILSFLLDHLIFVDFCVFPFLVFFSFFRFFFCFTRFELRDGILTYAKTQGGAAIASVVTGSTRTIISRFG
jgi:hypothetical protein